MKKIYLAPDINVVKVSSILLQTASNVTIEEKGDYGDGDGITLSSRQTGRNRNIWDDEEKEEEEW